MPPRRRTPSGSGRRVGAPCPAWGPRPPHGLQALHRAAVQAHRGDVHRRNFEDGDGDLHLLARGRGRRPIVDDDRVGHAGLVTGKSLDLRTATVRVGPAREMWNGALAALAGRKAHRAVSRSVFLRHWTLLRGKWFLVACDEIWSDATPRLSWMVAQYV